MESIGRRLPQAPCRQCKRRQMSWKGSNPRTKPYEKADGTCIRHSGNTSKPGCLECYTTLQKDDAGSLCCPNPECRSGFFIPALIPIPALLQHNTPVPEQKKSKASQAPLILRTHCRNCRLEDEICSGLISGPRCERCKIEDLECDCKILRRSCEECMKDRGRAAWKRCVGIRDECDASIEKWIECKEFVRVPWKVYAEDKPPEDAVGHGTMDVIDGTKVIRAFAACESCLDEELECDESLPACRGCQKKDVECKYRLLTTTSDFPGRRAGQRRSSLSRVHQEVFKEEDAHEVTPPQSRIPVSRGRCSKSKSRCSRIFPCSLCEKFGSECIPKPKASEMGAAAAKLKEIGTETKIEPLEGLMSDLDLEGWHLVSHKEVEEPVPFVSEST